MRLLLDTQAVLFVLDDRPLPGVAAEAMGRLGTVGVVSVASIWEMAVKAAVGKLDPPEELLDVLYEQDFEVLSIRPEHAYATRQLPLHHRDPFDRLLIAQAQAEHLPIVTGDPVFPAYDVRVIWS